MIRVRGCIIVGWWEQVWWRVLFPPHTIVHVSIYIVVVIIIIMLLFAAETHCNEQDYVERLTKELHNCEELLELEPDSKCKLHVCARACQCVALFIIYTYMKSSSHCFCACVCVQGLC